MAKQAKKIDLTVAVPGTSTLSEMVRQEIVRRARFAAWAEGYAAGVEDEQLAAVYATGDRPARVNPYGVDR